MPDSTIAVVPFDWDVEREWRCTQIGCNAIVVCTRKDIKERWSDVEQKLGCNHDMPIRVEPLIGPCGHGVFDLASHDWNGCVCVHCEPPRLYPIAAIMPQLLRQAERLAGAKARLGHA